MMGQRPESLSRDLSGYPPDCLVDKEKVDQRRQELDLTKSHMVEPLIVQMYGFSNKSHLNTFFKEHRMFTELCPAV